MREPWMVFIDNVMEAATTRAFEKIAGEMEAMGLTREQVMNHLARYWDQGDYFAEWYDEDD